MWECLEYRSFVLVLGRYVVVLKRIQSEELSPQVLLSILVFSEPASAHSVSNRARNPRSRFAGRIQTHHQDERDTHTHQFTPPPSSMETSRNHTHFQNSTRSHEHLQNTFRSKDCIPTPLPREISFLKVKLMPKVEPLAERCWLEDGDHHDVL